VIRRSGQDRCRVAIVLLACKGDLEMLDCEYDFVLLACECDVVKKVLFRGSHSITYTVQPTPYRMLTN
jgi:hypothetical protein